MTLKRAIALLLTLALLTGCAALAETAETEPAAEDPVLLTVNGEELRLSDAQPIYDYYVGFYEEYGYDMTDEANLDVIRAFTTREMLWTALIRQHAKESGLDVLSAEEEAELAAKNDRTWEDAIASYISYFAGVEDVSTLTEEESATLRANAIAYYEGEGFTRESTLRQERDAYINELVKAQMLEGEDTDVTEEDIAAHHAELAEQDRQILSDEGGSYGMSPAETYAMYTYFGYDLLYRPAGFRMVKHILLEADADALAAWQTAAAQWEEQAEGAETGDAEGETLTYEQVEAARAAVIASVLDTLDAIDAALESGVSFDELIAQYGTDPGMTAEPAKTEGYLVGEGSFEYDGDFVAGCFSVDQPGDISDPIVTRFGVHLIQYVSEVPEGPVPMTQEMHDKYLEELTADAEDAAFTAIVEHWIAEADIEYTEAGQPWNMDILSREPAGEDAEAETPAEETPAEEPAAETPAEEPAAETPAGEPEAEAPADGTEGE